MFRCEWVEGGGVFEGWSILYSVRKWPLINKINVGDLLTVSLLHSTQQLKSEIKKKVKNGCDVLREEMVLLSIHTGEEEYPSYSHSYLVFCSAQKTEAVYLCAKIFMIMVSVGSNLKGSTETRKTRNCFNTGQYVATKEWPVCVRQMSLFHSGRPLSPSNC